LEGVETVLLTEQTVNPGSEKAGPQDFELRKVLGKGGYGKVFQVTIKFSQEMKKNITPLIKPFRLENCLARTKIQYLR
jgi:hypothetical protein